MGGMANRRSTELRAFHELACAVGTTAFDGDEILERVRASVQGAFGFEDCFVVRLDEGNVRAVAGRPTPWASADPRPLTEYPALERALRSGEAEVSRPEDGVLALAGDVVSVPIAVDGRCVGFVVASSRRDLAPEELELLTALARVAAAFVEKADEFSRLDRAKSDFVSIASHELRTPIAVVHGIASTLHLRGSELREEQLIELRRTLFEQTSRLRELADQLLDLSRIEAGAVLVHPRVFRPREVLDALLPRLVPDRLGEIEVSVAPDVEVVSDQDAFERIVGNLVTNALRYGKPPIRVECERLAGFVLAVEDRGPGVEPEFVPRLFERFARSSSSRRAIASGAGLGLAIARSLTEALGGALTYEPAQPRGARFVLELPA